MPLNFAPFLQESHLFNSGIVRLLAVFPLHEAPAISSSAGVILVELLTGMFDFDLNREVKHTFYGKRQTADRRLPFAVLSSCASASRKPESSPSLFSWTGLFSVLNKLEINSLQCPPVRFREVPLHNFFAKCNVLIHFWPEKWSHYISLMVSTN